MDVIINMVLIIEMAFLIISPILVIIRNLDRFKKGKTNVQLLVYDITLALCGLVALVTLGFAIFYMGVSPVSMKAVTVWFAIGIMVMVLTRLIYDYKKEKLRERV